VHGHRPFGKFDVWARDAETSPTPKIPAMNSCFMEPGKEYLSTSRLGKPNECVRDKDREKDTSHSGLSVRPHGAKRDVVLASWLAAVDAEKRRL